MAAVSCFITFLFFAILFLMLLLLTIGLARVSLSLSLPMLAFSPSLASSLMFGLFFWCVVVTANFSQLHSFFLRFSFVRLGPFFLPQSLSTQQDQTGARIAESSLFDISSFDTFPQVPPRVHPYLYQYISIYITRCHFAPVPPRPFFQLSRV